jgi:hypothetical protein
VTLQCSCGDTFSDENPLNRDVIIPWFHAVAGHTLTEVEAVTNVEVKNQPRRSDGKSNGVFCEGSAGDLFQ